MKVLLTTRGSTGHLLPLVPFGRALVDAGHDVLIAAQRQHTENVVRTRLAFAAFDDPPRDEWMPELERFGQLGIEEANAVMVGKFFAGIDTRAALPGLRRIADEYRPDLILRESWEFASALVAELESIPIARVGLGLGSIEELSIRLAAPTLEPLRASLGLPGDADGGRLAATPYLTGVPEPLDDVVPATTHRFAHERAVDGDLPAWLDEDDRPLVYLTFGSVTPAEHLPYFPSLYRDAIEALAPLDVRILVTVGRDREPEALGTAPANVRVERWAPHDAVSRRADVVVCHGGYGSTLGTLAHGTPLVVMPLFSIDQWANAAAVERAGAGIALDAEYRTRYVLDVPGASTIAALPAAVVRILGEASYRRGAEIVAKASRALPPVTASVATLEAFAAAARGAAVRRA